MATKATPKTAEDKTMVDLLNAEGTVKIVVGTEKQKEEGGSTQVGINGTFWNINYGEEYEVPKAVARLLKNGKYAVDVVDAY